jgi:putative tricarboxylic transport membrane protein
MQWDHLIMGFQTFLSPEYLFASILGVLIGTIIGVLPGVGPATTMALMLPFTLTWGPTFGLIALTSVLCGAYYGGSTTSILVNIPGEAASVVTCIDGYQMAKKGRGGAALTLVAVGSFIAGTVGIIGLQVFAPMLANAALAFGAPEYFGLMVMSFSLLSILSGDSPLKGIVMFALGFWLSAIGISPIDGIPRFTFGSQELMLGIEFLPVAVGVFGISEVFALGIQHYVKPIVKHVRLRDLYPTKKEIKRAISPMGRGTILGFFVGLIPGPAAVIATFIAYAVEKRISKTPEEFGHGAIEGVVSPESANNSAAVTSLIPMLTLGVPFNVPMAILLAGLMMHGVEPGPLFFQKSPEIFWTLIAALYIGNIMLLILNLPLVGFFARIATIRASILMPFISMLCLLGVYSVRNNLFDVWVMVISGVVGVFFRKWDYPTAPLVIGLILGQMTENSLRKSLMIFRGDLTLFSDKPIALAFLSVAATVVLFKVLYPLFAQRTRTEKV